MKVARDDKNIYFYATTAQPLTDQSDPNWMVLFINTDRDATTGWNGYDFAVNRQILADGRSILEITRNGWSWVPHAKVKMRHEGNQLMVAVPRALLGLADDAKPMEFEFKWADNFGDTRDIIMFTTEGDAAPPHRFNYLYKVGQQ
jgi:hypothetical protein